jgi:hypothetical protein
MRRSWCAHSIKNRARIRLRFPFAVTTAVQTGFDSYPY